MTTPLLGNSEISVSQASKHATHNLALRWIEAGMIRVLSDSTTAQPGSPAEGASYILPASPTGTDWSGNGGKIAIYISGAWYFFTPFEGLRLHINDLDYAKAYDGTQFVADTKDPLLSKNVAGGTDVTLTAIEAANRILEFTGALTANISVIVPATTKILAIYNNTSGAFTLTVKVSGQTGVAVGQGNRAMLYCNGTDVVRLAADV